jgi:hypothetical protein
VYLTELLYHYMTSQKTISSNTNYYWYFIPIIHFCSPLPTSGGGKIHQLYGQKITVVIILIDTYLCVGWTWDSHSVMIMNSTLFLDVTRNFYWRFRGTCYLKLSANIDVSSFLVWHSLTLNWTQFPPRRRWASVGVHGAVWRRFFKFWFVRLLALRPLLVAYCASLGW